MSESDFVNMTRNGALCNAAGEIGAREFEAILRGDVITYLQVMVTRARSLPLPSPSSFLPLTAYAPPSLNSDRPPSPLPL